MRSGRHELRAGPVTVTYTAGDVRYLKVNGVEAVRRVFVGVRDAAWGTVPAEVCEERVEQRADGFSVSFTARHRHREIDFQWRGTIDARPQAGRVMMRYAMAGRPRRSFQTNRTGICVLHPVKECAGRACTVVHADGRQSLGEFPTLISPHEVFREVRALTYGPVEVEFEGEVFETEDQRNWSDGSFKTYCRSLGRGFPYTLEEGQDVQQAVEVRILAEAQASVQKNEILLGEVVGRLPEIGLCGGDADSPVQELNLSHVRRRIADDVFVEGDTAIVAPGRRPFAALSEIARVKLRRPKDKVGGGTVGNFAEVNRHRAEATRMELLAWPISPQVHATDDLSLVENLQGQADTVRTARSFAPNAWLTVGPVILHRRPDPFAAGKSGGEAEEVTPDPRQRTNFGAAWTLVSIKRLAEAGADSLTYYETAGPFGLIDGGRPFPLYNVFKRVGEMRRAVVVRCTSSDELVFDALALREGNRLRVMVASLRDEPVDVTLRPLPDGSRDLRLEPFQVALLDYEGKERVSR